MKFRGQIIFVWVVVLFVFSSEFILRTIAQGAEKILINGEYSTISTLDPAFVGNGIDIGVSRLVFQSLLRYKFNTGEIEGDLAKSWTISKDGLVYTFKLRDDANWHKGFGKFTAKDVKYTFDRILDPNTGSPGRSLLIKQIKEVRVIDDFTVEFRLNYPDAALLNILVGPRVTGIVCQKAVEKFGKSFGLNPIGTGPFIFESWSREQLVFVANKDFRQRGAPPKIDKVIYKVIPDSDTVIMALQRGENHLSMRLVPEQAVLDRLKASGCQITPTWRPFTPVLFMNNQKKPFDDLRVRRAIAHAIDTESLIKFVVAGMAEKLNTPYPKGLLGYTENNIPKYDYNPQKAKELLAQAGYPNGFSVVMDLDNHPTRLPLATAIVEQLRKVNISVKMEITDPATWWGKITKRTTDFTLNLIGWEHPAPDLVLARFYHSSSMLNVCRYGQIDNLIDAARKEMDPRKRLDYLHQIQRRFMEDLPSLNLMTILTPTASRNLSGVPEKEFIFGLDWYLLSFTEKK